MTRLTLGVDPGGRQTGVVLRKGDTCVSFEVIDCDALIDLPEVSAQLRAFASAAPYPFAVAVEGVQRPNAYHQGKLSITNITGLLGAAAVFGSVRTIWPEAVVVAPGGHGSHFLRAYPTELVGPREGKAGTGKLRHCRSAWDIAGAATRVASMGGAACSFSA